MENWTGIISGTNRGLILLNFDITKENKVVGDFKLCDIEDISLSGKVEGNIKGDNIVAKVFDFTPKQDGVPTEGTVNLIISADKKEMKGTWETNLDTKGECILYKFSITEKQQTGKEPTTLETKEIAIDFCSFDKKRIEEMFNIITIVAKSIRKGRERDIFQPIYSINYDKEERVRTYSLPDFFNKFNEANKIWYVGFELRDKNGMEEILINISYKQDVSTFSRSSVLVKSTQKDIVTMIPEMVRGLVGKARNRNSFWYHWSLEAVTQIFAVITMFAISFFVSKNLASTFPSQLEANRVYIFLALLIILSNLWTYFYRLIFNRIHKYFPMIEIINKSKNRLSPGLFVGVIASILAGGIIYFLALIWTLLF